MKKLLLNTFGFLAVFFTLLAFSSTASAVEKSFTIRFKTGSSNNALELKTSTSLTDVIAEGGEYVKSFSDLSKMYYAAVNGLKIGTASVVGQVSVNLTSPVKATKIEVLASASKNASAQKLEIGYQGISGSKTEFGFEAANTNENFKTCTLDATKGLDGNTEVSSIYLNKTSTTAYIFIKSITVYYNEDTGNPDNITPELTWTAEEVTAVLSDKSFNAPTLTVGPTEKAEEIKTLVEYKSSDPKVATIDEKGQITLVGRGKTTITAFVEAYENYNAQEASYELTVTYTPASLKWSAESVVVNMGDTFEAPTLTFEPEELELADNLAYTSSDPTVATIGAKTGAVEIVGEGTTVITASIKGEPGYEDAEASYTLSVVDPADVPDQYVLNFDFTQGEAGSTDQYTETWERSLNGFKWTISNFSNYNKKWINIRCGRKNNESVATITTATVIAYPVNEIDLRIDNMNVAKVNSVKLLTSTSATDFENPVHSIEIEKSMGVKVINIPNPQANLYYRLEFDCQSYSGNGFVEVGEVVYKLKKDNKESAELAYATTTVNKATTDQPFINPLTNEHGVEVVYSSDNKAVATVDAETGKVTVVGVGQAVISADFAGNETYSKQTVSYTLNVALGVNSIEETLALEDKTEVLINYPMTVAFRNGNNVFAVDEAGKFIQIYGSNSYAANDIIPAGWTGQYVLFKGNTPEITPVGALPEAVAGGSFVPAAVVDPTTVTTDMVNSVVLLKNAVIDAATPAGAENFDVTIAGNKVNVRNNYNLASVSKGVYDITVVVNIYRDAVSLYVASYKAVPAFRINGELVTTTTFDANGLKITLEAVLPEGHQMWYRFTPVAAASSQAVTDENGFTKYEGAFALEDPGQLEYYSVDPDQNKSEVYTLRLDNVTGINDIVVDGDNSEAVYYNLQGVRVDNPNTGIYLVRRAGRVSKVFVK